mgnify:CR=1 FL=1
MYRISVNNLGPETKFERRFCVFSTEGIVIAVDLSNHKLGRKAEKIIKKLPAFHRFSSLGKSFKIKYVEENKIHMIIGIKSLHFKNFVFPFSIFETSIFPTQ